MSKKTTPPPSAAFAEGLADSLSQSRNWTWPKGAEANIAGVVRMNAAGNHAHVPIQTLAKALKREHGMAQHVDTIVRRIKRDHVGAW